MTGFIESSNILEQLNEGLVHDLFRFFILIGIAVADLKGKSTQQVIQLLLAYTVVRPASLNQESYFLMVCQQGWCLKLIYNLFYQ